MPSGIYDRKKAKTRKARKAKATSKASRKKAKPAAKRGRPATKKAKTKKVAPKAPKQRARRSRVARGGLDLSPILASISEFGRLIDQRFTAIAQSIQNVADSIEDFGHNDDNVAETPVARGQPIANAQAPTPPADEAISADA